MYITFIEQQSHGLFHIAAKAAGFAILVLLPAEVDYHKVTLPFLGLRLPAYIRGRTGSDLVLCLVYSKSIIPSLPVPSLRKFIYHGFA